MYVESVPNRNSPPAVLLRESFRDPDSGKVKKRTLANLSSWDPEVVEGLKVLLKGGHASNTPLNEQFVVQRSLPHGHVAFVLGLLRQLKFESTLEAKKSTDRSLAIALIVGRILHPGSKLALSRQLNADTASSTLAEELGLNSPDEDDLYGAMRWLVDRQDKIESRLAKKYFKEDSAVLYDLSSTYYEGSHCNLAKFGYNRDGKKGKRQINFGLLCNSEGCPISVEVFPGNTSDPSTVESQLKTLRERFGLKRITLVGDRGMLTSARIEAIKESKDLKDFRWISALRSGQIQELVKGKNIQPELFDQRNLAEISAEEHFPGERLVVCRNPELAQQRARKRTELLAATEEKLQVIASACLRAKRPYRGKDKIGRRVERECAKYKMLKHFKLTITENRLEFSRNQESIAEEAALDGFYVVRSGRIKKKEMDSNQLVETYKSLSKVERAFRTIKTMALKIRPIFHRDEDMVKAHIFVCMLAYHLIWHLETKLKASLFHDEVPGGAPRKNAVSKAKRSAKGNEKAQTKKAEDGLPLHSFRTVLEDLSTLSRITVQPKIKGAKKFFKLTEPTAVQSKILETLSLTLKAIPPM